jgi:hypothetical protein
MEIILYIAMWIAMAISVLIIPFGAPGTFIIALLALVEGLLTDFIHYSPSLLIWLFGIAVALEGLEFLITGASAKKYGASNKGIIGAIVGAIAGAIIGSGLLPVIGTLIGTLAGAYLGAVGVEYARTQSSEHALRAGFGAFLGNAGGKFAKVLGAIIMIVIIARAFIR